jgi:hypothetical protein
MEKRIQKKKQEETDFHISRERIILFQLGFMGWIDSRGALACLEGAIGWRMEDN